MDVVVVTLVAVVILALIFDYINGFHDTANAIATVVSTGVLPMRTAILVAAVMNFLVIPREERALVEVFGEAYHDYWGGTRRWL